jgi:Zn-dependent alcohol dehydrogenase
MKFDMPHVLGSDIAGEVVRVGELCERVKPGWRVLLSPGLSCRQCAQCVAGQDNLCRRYTMFGYRVDGGNAEFLAAPEYSAIQIPDDMSFEQAAAVPLVFLTAWHMLMARAHLQPGEDVLVLAASSGVGSAAIQIAKLFQCRVIATAGGEAKLAKARELGRRSRDRSLPAGHIGRSAQNHRQARRGCGHRARGHGHLAEERGIARARRPPGHLRRHHGLRRQGGSALPVQPPAFAAGIVHGDHG